MLVPLCTLEGHTEDRVWHVSWSPLGTHLATCGEDKVVRIWTSSTLDWEETGSINCISTLEDAQLRTIRCCEWSPNGKHIACASFDGTVVVWEAQNREKTRWDQIAALEGHENEVKSVAWSPNGQWLATCGRDKKIWVWERIVSKNCYEFECVSMLDGHTQDVKFIIWHPNADNILFSASYDDTIKIWGCDEGDDEFYCLNTIEGHSNTVWGIDIRNTFIHTSNNGNVMPPPCQIVTCSADLSFKLWEHSNNKKNGSGSGNFNSGSSTWQEMACIKNLHKFPIYSVSWNTDPSIPCQDALGNNEIVHGNIIATGGGDNTINIIHSSNDESGVPVIKCIQTILNAHDGDINCVRWGPRIITDKDEENETDQYLAKINNNDGSIIDIKGGSDSGSGSGSGSGSVNMNLPTSHILATTGDDGFLKLWKISV